MLVFVVFGFFSVCVCFGLFFLINLQHCGQPWRWLVAAYPPMLNLVCYVWLYYNWLYYNYVQLYLCCPAWQLVMLRIVNYGMK